MDSFAFGCVISAIHIEGQLAGPNGGQEAERAATGHDHLVTSGQELVVYQHVLVAHFHGPLQLRHFAQNDLVRKSFGQVAHHPAAIGGQKPADTLVGAERALDHLAAVGEHVELLEYPIDGHEERTYLQTDDIVSLEKSFIVILDDLRRVVSGRPEVLQQVVADLEAHLEHALESHAFRVVLRVGELVACVVQRLLVGKFASIELVIVDRIGAERKERGRGPKELNALRAIVDNSLGQLVGILLHAVVLPIQFVDGHLGLFVEQVEAVGLVEDVIGLVERLVYHWLQLRPQVHDDGAIGEDADEERAEHTVHFVGIATASNRVEYDLERTMAVQYLRMNGAKLVQTAALFGQIVG